jgi:hypothetical protein
MNTTTRNTLTLQTGMMLLFPLMLLSAVVCAASPEPVYADPPDSEGFEQSTILEEAKAFFGQGAEGLGAVVEKAFEEKGRPNGYIKGEEVAGAIGIGVRYGEGELYMRDGTTRKVYWQGPSIGFDFGANAAKVFVLVYDLPDTEQLFQRFPGVAGSLYFVAGVGMNYLQSDDIVVAPIRFGVGWRQGANVGYMHFTREETLNPL